VSNKPRSGEWKDGVRKRPADAEKQVAALPRRVAHVAYATLVACEGGNPSKPSEIIIYDSESRSVGGTCSALRRAIDAGLVDRWAYGIYVPTLRGYDLKPALEDRFLEETEGEGDRL
jgi:hypothetical protein